MDIVASLGFLAIFCVVVSLSVYKEFLEQFPISLEYYILQNEKDWIFVLMLMVVSIYYVNYGLMYVCQCKITLFDLSCIAVFNCFACIELAAIFSIKFYGHELPYFLSIGLITDWVLLPLFSWVVVWTRFVQRGW